MKTEETIREFDELGRLVIPRNLYENTNIDKKDKLKLLFEDDRIILSKIKAGCIFCGEAENIQMFMGKPICYDCINELSR